MMIESVTKKDYSRFTNIWENRVKACLHIPVYLVIFLFSLNDLYAQEEIWRNETKSIKEVENIKFIFPSEVIISDRDYYIQQSMSSIQDCLTVIGEDYFTDSVTVEFLKNREEMKRYFGLPAAGMAFPDRKAMFCLAKEKTPVRHEWAHMVTMLIWGHPSSSLTWLNEGLATYMDDCTPYTREEIYLYFIQDTKLIESNDLVHNFYKQDEIISYFQASYLFECLLSKYEITQIKQLWQSDIKQFNQLFGKSFPAFIEEINNELSQKYPKRIDLDWEQLQKGCY